MTERPTELPKCRECGGTTDDTVVEMIDNKDGTKTPELWCSGVVEREHKFDGVYPSLPNNDPDCYRQQIEALNRLTTLRYTDKFWVAVIETLAPFFATEQSNDEASSRGYTDLADLILGLKYRPDQGMDAEMEAYNAALEDAAKRIRKASQQASGNIPKKTIEKFVEFWWCHDYTGDPVDYNTNDLLKQLCETVGIETPR